jgi:UDP-2,3-diacylglucosamine pyrophosphatase LpxH
MKYYRTIVLSDTHLGTRDCKAKLLIDFLRNNYSDYMYLNGDILDFWKVHQNKWYWKNSHSKVVKELIGIAESGTKVVYIPGNHDINLRGLAEHNINIAGITIQDQAVHECLDGIDTLILHGDLFDGINGITPWIAILGDKAYDFILRLNAYFNMARNRLGLGYWSLSKYLKHKVKGAVNFICKFEENLAEHCRKKGYKRIITGHIHHAEIRDIKGITYMNSGDWVESCTALVEDFDGKWSIVHWNEILAKVK